MRKTTLTKADLETIEWLAGLRWKGGPACTHCRKKGTSRLIRTRGIYQCTHCRHQFGVFSGTIFEGTRLRPFTLASLVILYFNASLNNFEEYAADMKEVKAKKVSLRWRGPISVRELERIAKKDAGVSSYTTIQRFHKKLLTVKLTQSLPPHEFMRILLEKR